MYDWNEAVRSLNVGLPDDIARLKAAGYYQEAIARIDRLLAEDWTKTQNGPASNGIAPPEGYVPPENPTPHGVDALREALTVQKEIMRRLPGEYCWTEAEAIARMQERVKDFTAEEFKKLDWEGRMDWRFVEGEKRYQARFAETLLATHADLAARKLMPDAPNNKNEERHRLHEKMEREGSASARRAVSPPERLGAFCRASAPRPKASSCACARARSAPVRRRLLSALMWKAYERCGMYPARAGRASRPSSGLIAPAASRASVDFPLPFAPITACTAPSASSISGTSSTVRPEYVLVMGGSLIAPASSAAAPPPRSAAGTRPAV